MKYTLLVGRDNEFYFNLKATNGEIILQSEGYESKAGAINGIESVQKHSQLKENYERRESVKGEPYFVLKANNHMVIGRSEMYSSNQAMEKGIASVCKNGPIGTINAVTEKCTCIIVNGRKKVWNLKRISYTEVIELAFGKQQQNANRSITVTYSKGHSTKPKGSLVLGQDLIVNPKMIFNVTATDKS